MHEITFEVDPGVDIGTPERQRWLHQAREQANSMLITAAVAELMRNGDVPKEEPIHVRAHVRNDGVTVAIATSRSRVFTATVSGHPGVVN